MPSVDVVGDIYDIPFEDIETSIYGCNSKHNHTNILDNTESTYRLVEMSWVGKRQYKRAKQNPETQMVDTTTKTNN